MHIVRVFESQKTKQLYIISIFVKFDMAAGDKKDDKSFNL